MILPHPSPRVIEEIRRLPKREGEVVQLVYRGLTSVSLGVWLVMRPPCPSSRRRSRRFQPRSRRQPRRRWPS